MGNTRAQNYSARFWVLQLAPDHQTSKSPLFPLVHPPHSLRQNPYTSYGPAIAFSKNFVSAEVGFRFSSGSLDASRRTPPVDIHVVITRTYRTECSHYSENTQDHDGTPPPAISLYRFLFASARATFFFLRLAPDVKALRIICHLISMAVCSLGNNGDHHSSNQDTDATIKSAWLLLNVNDVRRNLFGSA
ncbi:predicted protein [Histoplasma capsulatum var. duboisii H88]|uniref:Predicted protein n=1 Tax=Ajellomyces capsulatus (strain H88) TaxID=544711 RepID=F0UU51_AJEC8|nr:predicted protein [Histoplasma capsulatum var. duboisii H88]